MRKLADVGMDMGPKPRPLPSRTQRAISVLADVEPNIVARYISGGRIKARDAERIVASLIVLSRKDLIANRGSMTIADLTEVQVGAILATHASEHEKQTAIDAALRTAVTRALAPINRALERAGKPPVEYEIAARLTRSPLTVRRR